jgi:transposase
VLKTGTMRRTHLRFHYNIAKRMLIHVAGFNLGLLMRSDSASARREASRVVWLLRLRPSSRSSTSSATYSSCLDGDADVKAPCSARVQRGRDPDRSR